MTPREAQVAEEEKCKSAPHKWVAVAPYDESSAVYLKCVQCREAYGASVDELIAFLRTKVWPRDSALGGAK